MQGRELIEIKGVGTNRHFSPPQGFMLDAFIDNPKQMSTGFRRGGQQGFAATLIQAATFRQLRSLGFNVANISAPEISPWPLQPPNI